MWIDDERDCCAVRNFVGMVASKVLKKLVCLGFVNGEDESNENEGFVLRKVREGREDFGKFFE